MTVCLFPFLIYFGSVLAAGTVDLFQENGAVPLIPDGHDQSSEMSISLLAVPTRRKLRKQHGPTSDMLADGNLRWAKSANDLLLSNGISNPVGAEANFCSNGKLLPSFYLLGGPKCATTSVSMELGKYGGVRGAPVLWSKKEWHFWEKFSPKTDTESVKSSFLNALGACPEDRLVLGDFSINNLASVPKPDTMDLSPCTCDATVSLQAEKRRVKGMTGGDVPRLLRAAYGEAASNITLMMMIRSPMSRMQSSWYHAKAENFTAYWGFRDCCTESFNGAMTEIIKASDTTKDPPVFRGKLGGEGSVWFSLFGRQIEEYMKHFNASQMLIVPYKQYLVRERRIPICTQLRERLQVGLNCTNHEDFHENIHPHPPLDDDIDPYVKQTMTKMFEPEQQLLVTALSKASKGGAFLAGYYGDAGNSTQIEAWLTKNW